MPDPTSLPDQVTGNVVVASSAGSVATALTGGVTSMVFSHVGVLIGAFASKTIVAVFWITVPVLTPAFGTTVRKTLPSPPGGRKPASRLVGGRFVFGSRDW